MKNFHGILKFAKFSKVFCCKSFWFYGTLAPAYTNIFSFKAFSRDVQQYLGIPLHCTHKTGCSCPLGQSGNIPISPTTVQGQGGNIPNCTIPHACIPTVHPILMYHGKEGRKEWCGNILNCTTPQAYIPTVHPILM